MKTKLFAVEIFLCLVCISPAVFSQTEIKFTTLLQLSQSAHEQKKNYVLRSQAEWRKLWQQMQAASFLPRNAQTDSLLNKIDFNQQMLLAVFQGAKPSGGYSIAINKLVRHEKQIEVLVEEKAPGANCFTTSALTYPFHVIVMEKSAQKIIFNTRQTTTACR